MDSVTALVLLLPFAYAFAGICLAALCERRDSALRHDSAALWIIGALWPLALPVIALFWSWAALGRLYALLAGRRP